MSVGPFDLNLRLWPIVLLALLPALLNLGILAYVLARSKRNPLTYSFLLFVASLVVWQLSESLVRMSATAATATFWSNALAVGALLIGPFGVHFALLFTERRQWARSPLVWLLLYGPALAIEVLSRAGLNENNMVFRPTWGWTAALPTPLVGNLTGLWVAGLAFVTLALLLRYAWRLPPGSPKRPQAFLVAAGFAVPVVQGSVTQVLFPVFLGLESIPLASTFMTAFSASTFVALRRYRFLELPTIEEQLHAAQVEAQSRTEELVEAQRIAHLGNWVWDVPANRVQWSDEMYRIYGYAAQSFAVTFEKAMERVVPDDKLRTEKSVGEDLRRGQPGELPLNEYHVRLPDGRLRTLHGRGRLEVDAAGRPLRMIGTVQDVTEQKAAEERFRIFLESSPDPAIVANQEGRIVFANLQAEKAFGYSRAELLDQPLEHLVPERFRQRHVGHRQGYFNQPYARPMGIGMELSGRRKDGSEFPVEISLSPLATAEGLLVSSTIRDVTERKRAERTQREAEERLREVERLQEINAFKSQFINAAAHELKTPLTALQVQLYILRKERSAGRPLPEKDPVEILDRNIRRLGTLVDDLLDAARLQAARLGVRRERFDLVPVARRTVGMFEAQAQQLGVDLHAALAPELWVESDPDRLTQVLQNLLSNALKFTPAGGRVGVEAMAVAGDAVVAVHDTGVGLSQDQVGKLFQPFVRLHEATQTKVGGTGLGLYLSKGLVELMGGRIWCESPGPGGGSTFLLSLPLAVPRTLDKAARAVAPHAPRPPRTRRFAQTGRA